MAVPVLLTPLLLFADYPINLSSFHRWGQASALYSNFLVLQGGKTQGAASGGGGYTYTSAPSSSDLLLLDLSSGFPLSTVPWEIVSLSPNSPNPAPVVAFHTLSPLPIPSNSSSSTTDGLFLFGGDASPQIPIQTNNDSSYALTFSGEAGSRTASWSLADSSNWLQSQPERRIYHSAESDCKGGFWVVGGEKADGSNIFFNELWHLNATDSVSSSSSSPDSFSNLQSPPGGIVDGTSTLLSDGTLLMLGGLTSQGTLQPMNQVYSYSTTKNEWGTTSAAGANSTSSTSTTASLSTPSSPSTVPSPRRGHIAVSLPDQKVFIHGGANADLSVAYDDAWILDWSVDPPRWSQVGGSSDTSSTTSSVAVVGGMPSARFGHAAVAYGRNVLITLGWNGGNPVDPALYVWDGTGLTSSGQGSWSGGSWASSSYSPDPEVGSGGNSNSGSNGSSTSNGGSSGTKGNKPTQTSDPFGGKPTSSSDPKSKDGSSAGATAGAVFGALIGVGLIVGAGYAVYRRQQVNKGYEHWRRGDGADGLLGGGLMEKESYGDGGIRSSSDPRGDSSRFPFQPFFSPQSNRDLYTSPNGGNAAIPQSHTFGNVGHAMEGSGPHFRERLAMLTGIGFGGAAAKEQPRFDMLADEDEDALELDAGDSYAMRQNRRSKATSYGGRGDFDSSTVDLHDAGNEDEDEEDDEEGAYARRVRERSYGRVEQEDLDDDGYGFSSREGRGSAYVTSPFEDPSDSRKQPNGAAAVGGGLLAGAIALATTRRAERDERFEIDGVSVNTAEGAIGTDSGPSSQSHGTYDSGNSNVNSSNTGSWSGTTSSAPTPGGVVSFSDASHGKGRSSRPGLTSPLGPRANPSPLIRRSPTWWDRFMGTSFITSGPNSEQPIRDPAVPPVSVMTAIRESPRPSEPSYEKVEDPFRDLAAADELGRRNENGLGGAHYDSAHGRSLSSLQSARTGTSSHLEAQFRNMDVVQRTRTGSSRRTGTDFSSDAETSSLPSRAASLRRNEVDEVSTPGSVVWEGESWEALQNPHSTGAKASSGVPTTVTEEEINPDGSLDISELNSNPFNDPETLSSVTKPLFSNSLKSNPKIETKTSHVMEASETPSVTKRARLNPILTSPLSPQPVKEKSVPLSGSVRERVQALEKERSAPTSPSTSASRSPNRSLSALATPSPSSNSNQNLRPSIERSPSKSRTPSPKRKSEKVKYEHGLAPKAQLFVANPDRRGSSTSSSS